MSFEDELRKEKALLEERKAELKPYVDEDRTCDARLDHINALLGDKPQVAQPLTRSRKVNWAEVCRRHNLYVGGDSAHRVVKRLRPDLHSSTSHPCTIK